MHRRDQCKHAARASRLDRLDRDGAQRVAGGGGAGATAAVLSPDESETEPITAA